MAGLDGEMSDAAESPEDVIQRGLEELTIEHGVTATFDDGLIMLPHPVTGAPHLAVLQALGAVAKAGRVGAAAHGPAGVAAAVWQAPELFIVRWTARSRWVASYKFPARARPDEYLREDTGIPSHLGKGNWYGDVPDEVTEAFFSVGLLLDEPPFPVPQPPPPPPEPVAAPPKARRAPAEPRAPRAPRAPRPRPAATPKRAAVTTRTCTGCNLQKHLSQFVEGSELCVDCR